MNSLGELGFIVSTTVHSIFTGQSINICVLTTLASIVLIFLSLSSSYPDFPPKYKYSF